MEDLRGVMFYEWKVLSYAGNEMWNCECSCGTRRSVWRASLIRKRSRSCGCRHSPTKDEYHLKVRERNSNSISINEKDCWNWIKSCSSQGYGQMTYRTNRSVRAHRVSYLVYVGDIPDGLFVLHKCDNKLCVNPKHLFLGTHKDNMNDMKKKGRACKGENSHLHSKNRGKRK